VAVILWERSRLRELAGEWGRDCVSGFTGDCPGMNTDDGENPRLAPQNDANLGHRAVFKKNPRPVSPKNGETRTGTLFGLRNRFETDFLLDFHAKHYGDICEC
jgi:hypothetical protein